MWQHGLDVTWNYFQILPALIAVCLNEWIYHWGANWNFRVPFDDCEFFNDLRNKILDYAFELLAHSNDDSQDKIQDVVSIKPNLIFLDEVDSAFQSLGGRGNYKIGSGTTNWRLTSCHTVIKIDLCLNCYHALLLFLVIILQFVSWIE